MKSIPNQNRHNENQVAPFAGVWIEILFRVILYYFHEVAPFAGVWIEIIVTVDKKVGLKVAPFAGVWIEIKR